MSFFVDAYFDKSDRKWFWGNENEIQADQWAYQCSNLPHQPATDLVVTIKFDEISKYFLEIVNRCSSEGDVSTETDEFGNTLKCCTIRNREILLTLEFLGKYHIWNMRYSLIRPFLCSNQIDNNHLERIIKPKNASYIDALIECTNRASKIASISEIEKYSKILTKIRLLMIARIIFVVIFGHSIN